MSEDDALAWLMDYGENVYLTGGGGAACVTCHQANGQGVTGAFPPLAGSGDYYGDCENHAGLIINGLNGEIEVQGVTYNAVMPAQANLTDHEIAAVITYVRKSWGNDDGHCMPAQVASARLATAE
ncbi:MAG: mono/diheme cytochrome c family protein [Myxococcota bacterium]|jgi:mono/diheme cytochrome c family protein